MKKEKDRYDRQPAFLYERCMPAWWPALDTQKKITTIRKGDAIFSEGDEVKGVYFMIGGVVKVHKHWGEDKELILRFARQRDILGHRGLSTHSAAYPVSATALSTTRVCFLDLAFFHSTLHVNPGFLFDFMMFFADELQLSEQRMRDLAHMTVRNRLAKTLLYLADHFGIDEEGYVGFPMSRQDIASFTGAAYETVYKILAEFCASGIIRTDGKKIAILDAGRLISEH
ncbi:MAG: Crp/Fnr family transcriptional regulator [Bacteroidota bacterium]|nr:Crp/Fnr family transcriptional regulator [Bacteroidota bacterium]